MPTPYHMRPTMIQVSPAQVSKTCPGCKKEFWIVRNAADKHVHCSKKCRLAVANERKAFGKAAEIMRLSEEAKKLGTLILENRAPANAISVLTPQYSAQLRGKIASLVHDHLLVAEKVLTGELSWTNSQVSLFKALLAKVVPDVSATFHQHELNSRVTSEMTREELEALAAAQAQGATIDHHQSTEGRPSDLNDGAGVWTGHVRPGPEVYPRRQAQGGPHGSPGEDHDQQDP